MSALLSHPERPVYRSEDRYTATDTEIRDSFLKFLDYCGIYAFHENEGFMLHRVQGSSLPNWVGSVQKRFYVLNGSWPHHLTPPIPTQGDEWASILVWKKIERVD